MATAILQDVKALPSSEKVEPGSCSLPMANFPVSPAETNVDAHSVASTWIDSFNKTMSSDLSSISNLFLPESYWRDQLCLSWDLHTLQGPERIKSLLSGSKAGPRILSLALDESRPSRNPTATAIDPEGKTHAVQAFLSVETNVGRGGGIVRIVQDRGIWKVFTLFTFLKELKGHEELLGKKRPHGVEYGEPNRRQNWLEKRKAVENFEDGREPTVLILGAGQAGLAVAARLKMLGVESLIVDREERVGDNWRNRYHHLVLHDPVWYDHLPYLPFPANWPVFTPKDKLGDWFESYARTMELNVWTETSITKTSWDDASQTWSITVERLRNGTMETRDVHPKHVIQATGASGQPNFPSHIKGLDSFAGTRLVHSSKFPGASPAHGQNKRAIVVGSCNSGHDIAQDFYENGYHVTMVQRSSTFVVGAETILGHLIGLFGEDGPPTDDADALFHSVPNSVLKRMNIAATKAQNKTDEKIIEGLKKAGFSVDKGPEESGLWMKYLQRGGGYYLDVGCSQLIIDGKVKIKQGIEITSVLPNGLQFADDSILEADEIVFATGYQNMRTQCRLVFGDEVADRVKDVWGFDEEGEIRTMWRASGHPGFWFMGGNLALCRWFSRVLALQVKARVEGIVTDSRE